MFRILLSAIVLTASLTGCAPVAATPTAPAATQSASPTDQAAQPTMPPIEVPGRALTLWVPPRFSPDDPDEASTLFSERLREFESTHPGVRVETRVKAQSGPASLLVALTAARQAAPSVMPDLVILDAADLAIAYATGLIAAWESTGTTPDPWTWVQAVADSARSNGVLIGLPFGAEADVFAYRTAAFPAAPRSWVDTLTGSGSFLFPAGDPSSEFTLAQYLSSGGTLRDTEGKPALDPQALQAVLEFYSAARAGGLLPLSSRQYEDSHATMAPLMSGQVGAAIVPFDQHSSLDPEQIQIAGPWPSRDGSGTCLVRAWSWAVVDRLSGPDAAAVELAIWLARPEFTGPWTRALSLLPSSPSARALWPDDASRLLAEAMGATCLPLPSPDDLELFGPALRDATGATLTGEISPEQAAAAAAAAVARP